MKQKSIKFQIVSDFPELGDCVLVQELTVLIDCLREELSKLLNYEGQKDHTGGPVCQG
jgi:hypothetical protein